MKNTEKFEIVAVGRIESAEMLKQLQADIRKLPNFGGKGVCCDNVTNRDFWAVLKDRRTGEIWSYYGSKDSFNHWGQQPAVSAGDAEAHITTQTCWLCGGNPKTNPAVTLKLVEKIAGISMWECEGCNGLDTSKEKSLMNTLVH